MRDAGKKRFEPPAGWLKFLGLSAKTKRVKGKVMPLRSFHMLVLQVYHEKIQADENAMSESTPCQSMADYVVNFMLFKFGTRKLVQKRVSRCDPAVAAAAGVWWVTYCWWMCAPRCCAASLRRFKRRTRRTQQLLCLLASVACLCVYSHTRRAFCAASHVLYVRRQRPLPTQCLTAMLETLELGFRGGFSSVLLSVRVTRACADVACA